MLIKAIYRLPDKRRYLVLLPDGHLYTMRGTIARRVTPDDLRPVLHDGSVTEYLAMVQAEEIEIKNAKHLQIWIQTLGISKSPLQAARFDACITQKQLAEMSGVSLHDIQNIEGYVSHPGNVSIRSIISLARSLSVDPRSLIADI